MDLELLRTFLELNRTRHFGRSAEALHITQAAVSSRLKSLEAQLGVTLFERTRREMRLTPEGGRLIRHAERQIAAWRAARQDVTLAESSEQLVIGGSLRLWDVLLQRWLHDLRRAYPKMAIIAESQSPDVLTRRLIDGTLDVAIMLEPAQLDIMHVKEITSIEFVCVSNRAGLSIDDALRTDYVFVDWGLTFGLDHRRVFPDAPESMTRVSHAKMALEYINTVGGSAYLPRAMVGKDVDFGLLHQVVGAPTFERQAYATYPVRSPRIERVEESLALIRK
ncbi:MAG: LysR family transcriptional regulator [Gammaproteobacteria bacterium]|nr:LysR family transcriptional regulator [Gammaproteobacteria bacterium]